MFTYAEQLKYILCLKHGQKISCSKRLIRKWCHVKAHYSAVSKSILNLSLDSHKKNYTGNCSKANKKKHVSQTNQTMATACLKTLYLFHTTGRNYPAVFIQTQYLWWGLLCIPLRVYLHFTTVILIACSTPNKNIVSKTEWKLSRRVQSALF